MASRVYQGYDEERRSYGLGDTIRIRRPGVLTAQNAPSAAQDLRTGSITLTLDQWKEVKFVVNDKELAYTGERIIREHIQPAAYALADNMDQALAALYKDVPYVYDYGTAADHTIITGARKVLFDNTVPLMPGMIHMMVDSTLEMNFLNSQVFHSAQIVGGTDNQDALLRGTLGTRFGVEVFANQNTPLHTAGTAAATGGDGAGTVTGAHLIGATSLTVGGFTGTETLKDGDSFVIAGNTQRYVVTADAAWTAGAATISIYPGLATALSGSEVVTFTQMNATAQAQQLIFHRDAFAYAMAPLPENLPGIDVATATDPSGLSVRARTWADGANSQLFVALDVLYGCVTLNGNLACRAWT